MQLSTNAKPLDCQHDDYCGLSKSVCIETDFSEKCHMKQSDINDLPLLKSVKERIERDRKREAAKR